MYLEMYKFFGVLSIVLTWTGLLFIISKWRGNPSMTFSLHIAKTKASYLISLILFSITLVLFYLFMLKWFVPTFHLPLFFLVLITIACLSQYIPIIIPHKQGRKAKVHLIGAIITAVALIPIVAILFLTPQISFIGRTIALMTALYMLLCFFLFAFVRKLLVYSLYFEGFFILSFHLTILAAVYLR